MHFFPFAVQSVHLIVIIVFLCRIFEPIVANLATHIRLAASLEVFMDGSSFYHLYDLTFVSLHRRELETNVPKK